MSIAAFPKPAEPASYEEVQREHNRVHYNVVEQQKRRLEQAGIPYVNWTNAALESAEHMMDLIILSCYDDDVLADFGSRNGHVADHMLSRYSMRMLCVDLLEEYVEECQAKGHKAICADLQKLPLGDGSVDWGFSHHTLEHTRDLAQVATELTRVVKRGLFLAFPIEDDASAAKNPSHMHHSTDPDYFLQHFLSRGWRLAWSETGNKRPDFQCFLYK